MIAPLALGAALLGLSSTPHCAAMCGPLQCAFLGAPVAPASTEGHALRTLALGAGRLATYALLGALAGTFGAFGAGPSAERLRLGLRLFAALALAASAAKLAGYTDLLAPFEAITAGPFRGARRLVAPLLPARTAPHAFVAGLLWGLVPCAVVWGAVLAATGAGSVAGGAAVTAAFGVGTLPGFFGLGALAALGGRLAGARGRAVHLLAVPVAGLALWTGVTAVQDFQRPHACCDAGKAATAILTPTTR